MPGRRTGDRRGRVTAVGSAAVPSFDVDLFSDENLTDPYPLYRRFREAGPVVYVPAIDAYVLSRWADVRLALGDHETFISGRGVFLNDFGNTSRKGVVIATDNPLHDQLRSVLAERLSPRALRQLRAEIQRKADAMVAEVVARGSFDAVSDLAQAFPLAVVCELIGMPQTDKRRLLEWADAGFNLWGPPNRRTLDAMPVWQSLIEYIATQATRDKLAPGSMGAAIYEAADRGLIAPEQCPQLLVSYLVAGVDTTIAGIANAIVLFAANPEQWELVRAHRSLIPSAFEEVLRLETPLQLVRRWCVRETVIDGATIPAERNAVMIYASANRDERKWPNPERFDARRNPIDHVAFGYGLHGCAGQGLARLEVHAILSALADRVARFETGTPVRRLNNVARGLAHLPLTVTPA